MKKQRHTYHLNPHTLRYEKVFVSLRQRLQGIGFNVLLGVVLGVALVIIGLQFMQSPNERLLRRELDHYRRHTASLNERVERAEKVLLNLEERDDALYRAIFESEPVPRSERYSGIGGVERYADFDGDALLRNTTRRVDNLDKRLYVQSKSLDEVYDMALNKSQRLASLPAIMPVQKDLCQVVSGFGNRFHPILKSHRLHSGIDLAAHPGTPVYATGDAVVRVASYNPQGYSGYGIVIILDHGFGIQTLYAHMQKASVRPGQRVKRGEQIGTVGNSGMSSGSHLHYEVSLGDRKVDPVYYFSGDLSPEEYQEVLEQARKENQCMS